MDTTTGQSTTRLHQLLPRSKWKFVSRIVHADAAKQTGGNTDKFTNHDYWVLGEDGYKPEVDLPIGTRAVHYKDKGWWVVEKIKMF